MARLLVVLSLGLVAVSHSFAQDQGVPRDAKAIAILTQTFKALGGSLPADSQASGTFDRVAGSTKDSGSIQVLTRGYTQTSETLAVGDTTTQLVFSQGYAVQKDDRARVRLSLERSLSSDSAIFPLVLVAAAVQDPNSGVQFIASETVNGVAAYHVKVWRIISDQNFAGLSEFAAKDIWVATDSGLPLEVAYEVRDGDGAASGTPVAIFFSDYRSVNGIVYPFLIAKNVNGTPYMTIHISNVSFDTGLTDSDFALR